MSNAGTASARMPNAIWEARRAAGLTEKALAERLGVSLWEVERLENGELDPAPYAEALERHTGRPRSSFRSNGDFEPPQAKPSAEEVATPELISPAEHTAERLVLGSIALLVLIRFFTEVVPVVPRAANFVDVPIVVALGVAALLRPPVHSSNDSLSRWLPALGFAFLVLSVLAAILNPSRVDIAPALVFIYGVLSPLLVYGAVRRLWPVGRAAAASTLLLALGAVELLVVGAIDIPRFAAGNNPDDISGTFGTNAYQLVFFLLLFIGLLAGIYSLERRRAVARFAPLLIVLSLAVIVLAQYRALLVTTGLCLLLTAVLLRRRRHGLMAAGIAMLAFMAALAFGAAKLPVLKLDQTLNQDPASIASQRLEIADQVERLYNAQPQYIATGTGPGTFSSRGWQTFALGDSTSESNVAGAYALSLTGGEVYRTDVSDRYVRPLLERTEGAVAGSRAVSSPFSEYLAVAAETGLLGLLILIAIYAGAFAASLRRTIAALRNPLPSDPLPALLLTTTIAFFALLQMGLLENWLEVTRLTFIAFALLAISIKEFDARSEHEGR